MAVLNHTYPFYTTSKGHGKHLKLPFAMMQPEREIERDRDAAARICHLC